MSHFVDIKTQIRDSQCLQEACRELGLQWKVNEIARGYNGNSMKGEYVIGLSGPYDIAVNRQSDGTYALTTDWWAGHAEKEVGAKFGRLIQMYGAKKVQKEAAKRGARTTLTRNGTRLEVNIHP